MRQIGALMLLGAAIGITVPLDAAGRVEPIQAQGQPIFHAAHQQDVRLAVARDEHAQQLHAVGIRQMQVEQNQRRAKRVDERQELGSRGGARTCATDEAW